MLKIPSIDFNLERQLADTDTTIFELETAGTVEGVPVGGGNDTVLTGSYLWQSESPAATGTHKRFYVDRAGVITAVRPNVVNGDGTALMQLEVLKNGSTIYPSATKPNVSAGNFVNGSFTPDTTSFSDGDYLQINVISTGNTLGPIRLLIKFEES